MSSNDAFLLKLRDEARFLQKTLAVMDGRSKHAKMTRRWIGLFVGAITRIEAADMALRRTHASRLLAQRPALRNSRMPASR